MSRSYIADEIDREYRREQFYKRKKRQKCKETECKEKYGQDYDCYDEID